MHRLAWFYYYGEFPGGCIDHIDNDKANNKISNFRIANKSQNGVNRGLQKIIHLDLKVFIGSKD
ncbi:HNH endonuclease [Salmonella enterica subsp. enterica]|nr:HNH endonuclease [Salmonella enterica subsp. enterica serovar Bovismorbificans]